MTDYSLEKIENSNVRLLLQAAKELGINWVMVDDDRYQVLLEKNNQVHEITAHSFRLNSPKSIQLTQDKYRTYNLLKKNQIPVLPKLLIKSENEYLKNYHKLPFPQVVKPSGGEKGRQVFLNIKDKTTALSALKQVLARHNKAIIEPYFIGHDIRILLLNHQVIGLSRRHAPEIVGDGKQTIAELIEKENQRRTALNTKAGIRMLNRFLGLKRIRWYLEKNGLSLATVLPKNKIQKLHELPNYSAGGGAETLELALLHPSFLHLCEKISRLVGLTIVGIDLIIKDLEKPALSTDCAVLELNSDPGLRLHDLSNKGKSQQVCQKVLKYIFGL